MLALVAANAVAALAVQTVLNEVVGGSNGTPSQQFTLSSTPVIDQSLTLQIDEGSGPVTWTEVDDFAVSGPNDLVYMLDPTPGTITLGDGIHGHIPVVDLSNPTGSIVALQYQFGGGARSNIAAGTALTLMTSIPGIDTANISTPFAAYGGTDEEALQDAIDRAPQALQTQNRAVTAADYELLATQAGPIARAKALPLYHPDFPGMSVPGVVTVIVVPNVSSPAPMPSPGLLRTVCAYLDARRLIATELYVIAPTYVPVTITLQVLAQPDADTGTVELAVEAALTTLPRPDPGRLRRHRLAVRRNDLLRRHPAHRAGHRRHPRRRGRNQPERHAGCGLHRRADPDRRAADGVRPSPRPSPPIRRRWGRWHDQHGAVPQSAARPAARSDCGWCWTGATAGRLRAAPATSPSRRSTAP